MKALFRSIEKYIRVIIKNIVLLLGIGLFVSGIVSFSSRVHTGIDVRPSKSLTSTREIETYPVAISYYYGSEAINSITVGAVLIAVGLLVRAEKN